MDRLETPQSKDDADGDVVLFETFFLDSAGLTLKQIDAGMMVSHNHRSFLPAVQATHSPYV